MSVKKETNPRTLNAVSLGAILIAIALGLIVYAMTEDMTGVACAILIVLGLYLVFASFFYSGDKSGYGPSTRDMTLVAGGVLAAIGAAVGIQAYNGNTLITIGVFIIIIAVIGIIMAVKNRND